MSYSEYNDIILTQSNYIIFYLGVDVYETY